MIAIDGRLVPGWFPPVEGLRLTSFGHENGSAVLEYGKNMKFPLYRITLGYEEEMPKASLKAEVIGSNVPPVEKYYWLYLRDSSGVDTKDMLLKRAARGIPLSIKELRMRE